MALYGYVDNDPINQFDPLGLFPPSNPTCQALKKKIENIEADIARMTRELYDDPQGLPGKHPGDKETPSISRRGHQMKLNMAKAHLAAKKALYQANCSDPEPPPKKPWYCPQPMFAGQPVSPRQAALGLGVAAGGALIIAAPEAAPVLIPVLAP